MDHPAMRFQAPASIRRGVPLKHLMGRDLVLRIAESLHLAWGKFDKRSFALKALSELDELELMPRARLIGLAMGEHLPSPFSRCAAVLIRALGPELAQTEKNGMAPFFYLPHSFLIGDQGVGHLQSSLSASYELTKRFTAEFCIRPLLIRHRDECLDTLKTWTLDANPHVRRLCSEGSRPRLPWGIRLTDLQKAPQLTIPILERLKDDPEVYVRKSVANHLGDILKDHADLGFDICQRWLHEAARKQMGQTQRERRHWLIRHAVRLPAKKGNPRALRIRNLAK